MKIRIGYVLKSADVRTQVSSRYSENSSHTYPCTSAHPHAQPCTSAHTRTHPCTPAHICAHPCIPAQSCVPQFTFEQTHTRTHPCTPEKTSHIPAAAHGLNLINSYQIRVNRKMGEDRKIERKIERKIDRKIEKGRKEQESAEAIRIIKPHGPIKFWRGK